MEELTWMGGAFIVIGALWKAWMYDRNRNDKLHDDVKARQMDIIKELRKRSVGKSQLITVLTRENEELRERVEELETTEYTGDGDSEWPEENVV